MNNAQQPTSAQDKAAINAQIDAQKKQTQAEIDKVSQQLNAWQQKYKKYEAAKKDLEAAINAIEAAKGNIEGLEKIVIPQTINGKSIGTTGINFSKTKLSNANNTISSALIEVENKLQELKGFIDKASVYLNDLEVSLSHLGYV